LIAEETRFVIEESVIEGRTLIDGDSMPIGETYTDYYLTREKRIRHFVDRNKRFLIESIPGSIDKDGYLIRKRIAEDMIDHSTALVIEKRGVGAFEFIEGVKGYVEYVHCNGTKELHIEFEFDDPIILQKLEKTLKPKKVFRKGLFDYFTQNKEKTT
jgi:hypothetical protein